MKNVNDHNREEIIDAYANAIVDGIDLNSLVEIAVDSITKNLKEYTNEKLEKEIKETMDYLLEDDND